MEKLRARFGTGDDELDWDVLKRQSMFPDLIGRKSEDIKPAYAGTTLGVPSWLHCGCGMMVMTSRDLHGGGTVCANCKQHQHDAVDGIGSFAAPRNVALKPQAERRVLFGLVLFCLIGAGAIGSRMLDAPPRAQADGRVQLD